MLKRLSSAWRKLTASGPAPTSRDRKTFQKCSLRYLRQQGWILEEGLRGEFFGKYGRRRIFIYFFPDERDMTELHIMDWNEARIRAGRPMYVFSQAKPHEAFIKLAAERCMTLRHFPDVCILDLTEQDHADEARMLKSLGIREPE